MNDSKSIFQPDGKNAIHDGIEHEPTGGKGLIDPTDTALLLLDHQSGLFQNVKDISITELRANTTALARVAALLKIPVITTASVPDGPNGPLMPEIHQAAPHAVYVPRKGEVNAWDNALFAKTVRETGKKTLIMAGVWTSVCVMFPALDAKAAGFKVQAVIDASGDPSEMASRTSIARFSSSWRSSDERQRGHLRVAPDLEPPRGPAVRGIAYCRVAELRSRHGELSKSASGRAITKAISGQRIEQAEWLRGGPGIVRALFQCLPAFDHAHSHCHHSSRPARLRSGVSAGAARILPGLVRARRRAGRNHDRAAARFGLARVRHPAHVRRREGARRLLRVADVQGMGGEVRAVD